MTALPPLTPEQREHALNRAREVRAERRDIRQNLKKGDIALADVIRDSANSEVIAKTKVTALLESLPGVGKIRAAQIMERLGIDPGRRVRGLGANQREALVAEFAAA